MNHLNSRLLLVMLLPALWLVTKPIFGQQRTLLQNDAAQAVVRNAQEIITDIQSDPRFIRFKPGTSFESIKSFNQTLALPTQSDLTFKSSSKDNLGFDHIKYTQTYKGIKILGSEYIFHLKGQSAISANGNIIKDIDVDIRPSIDEGEALSVALKSVGADEYMWEYEQNEVFLKSETGDENASFQPHGELFISSKNYDKTEPFKLVYRFDIYASKPLGRYNVEIDAQTGKVVNSYNTIHTSNIDVAATGESLYNGTVDIVANHNGTDYKLTHSSETSRINTYDLANGTNYSAATLFSETDSHFDEPNSRAGVSAHYGATATYAYFYNNFGRNSFDDAAGEINSYVHYSTNYVNAFWDGSRMTYGDGDGVSTTPLVSLDIVGHEIAHAVTQYSAGLIYSYESGALNESFSDIFGQSIEFETAPATASWYLADEIFTDGVSRIRAMQDPNANGHPDTYLGDFWFTGSGDNGGVHFNSGVQNFWYYLLVEGGSGVNDNGVSYNVPSIGLDAAQQIAYRNLTVYLTPSSQYVDARVGSEQAAADLFGIGSLEYNATVAAWNAVGVPSAEPVLSLADAIDFGNVPVGFPKTVDVNVANTGNGILEIQGIQIDNGAYSVSDPVFNLTELSSRNITFTLTPTVLGDLSATATVYSNADTVTIALSGVGVGPPNISVTPDSLSEFLYVGGNSIQTLNIDNSAGVSDLEWELEILSTATTTGSVNSIPDIPFMQIQKGEEDPRIGPAVVHGLGGPDGFGYAWSDSDDTGGPAYVWEDISSTGTNIVAGMRDDNVSGPFPLGFDFDFYGNTYSEFYVSSNGFIRFGFNSNSGCCSGQPLPLNDGINNIIAWAWRDNHPQSGNVYYQNFTDKMILQFQDYGLFATSGTADAQIIIYKNGNIKINYDRLTGGYNTGRESVGIENEDGTEGLQVAFNTPYLHDNLALLFSRPLGWIDVAQTFGTVPAGQSRNIDVLFDASGLDGGLYETTLGVTSNDPANSEVSVPVALTVAGSANIELSTASIDFGLQYLGASKTDSILITNVGSDLLVVNNVEVDNSDFIVDNTSFSIPSGTSQALFVTYTPADVGTDIALLTISSNDVDESSITVNLSGESVLSPMISVSPDSLSESVLFGQTTTATLTIDNSGGGDDLIWSAQTRTVSVLEESPLFAANKHLTSFTGSQSNGDQTGRAKIAPISMETINALTGNVQILSWNLYADTSREFPNTMNAISQYFTDYTLATTVETDASTLETLLVGKDILLIPEQERGGGFDFYNDLGIAWSTILNDFVTGGGTVIMCGTSGRSAEALLNASGLMNVNIGTIYPFIMNVSSTPHYLTSGLEETVDVQNGTYMIDIEDPAALELVTDNDGIGVGVGIKEVGLGAVIYIAYDFFDYDDDAARIISNAVANASNTASWITMEIESGTVPAGASQNVAVTLGSSDLPVALYDGEIEIGSNDPIHPNVIVPVQLDVSYGPGLDITPDSISASLIVGQTGTETLTIDNSNGLQEFAWEAAINGYISTPSLNETVLYVKNKQLTSYVEEENNGVVAQGKVGPISMDIINGLTGTKEILSWNLGADLSREFPNTMNAISQYFTDYTLTTTVETDPEILSSLLADKEVFLIPEQEIGGSSTFYTSLATLWAPVLNDFVNNGGSIIMCGTWSGTGVFEIFNNSGLISLGQGSISFGQDMIVEDMPHYLTEGLGDVVVSQDATYLLELQDSDALELVTYQGDAAVIVKEIGSGNVTYIAYDYFDYDDDAARIISNAVANAGSQGTAEWITIDAFSGTIPAGTSQNIEVNLDATTLVSGLYQATVQITSDNLTTPELNVPVALEVTNGPGVFINPDSITTTLVVGQVTDEVLTIDNSAGVFDVQWEANIGDYVASPSLSKTALYLENEHLTSFSSTENNGMMGMGKVAPISMEVINGMDGNKRILAWNLYTDTFGEFPNTMNAISQYFTDYTLTTTIETDPDALSTLLVDQDILLIPEKETGGNQSFYANLASSWGPTLDDFVRSGGTIIMCGSSSGFGVYELFNSSNLMSMSPASRINSGDLVVDDTAHYLTEGLGETFGAENATFLIDLQDSDALQLASYQGDAAVAVKEIGSGAVVYIAYDYYAYNDEAARLIANAVANAGAGTNWLTIDSLSGTIPAGSSQNIVGTLDATQLSTGTYSANIRITSDNLTTPELEVPVELEVIQGIGLEVDPSSFEESVDKGGTVVRTMTLDNSEGVVDVSWQANIAPRQGFETEASGTVKVLVWDRFIRYGILDRINDAISLHFNDFTITTTSEESPDSLGGLLNTHDVFIIAEQRSGNASYYNDLGNSWAPELQKFVRRGGTIVQNSWRYSTHEILAAAELLEFTGVYSSYSGKVTKSQFKLGHYLLQGVATFNPIEFVAPVVTTDDPEAQILMMENKHRAAFLTKDVSHGRVIYIGLTYYYGFTNSTARILANSISTSRRNASWLTLNQTSGVVAAGSIREVDVVIDGSDLFGGEYKADIVLESDALASSMLNIPVDLTVNESIEPLVVESTCTDNPDSLRAWTITNTNGFDRRAFWFIVGTSLADSITLHPSENVLEIPTQTSVPNTLKLRWLDKDGNQQEVTVESTAGPCRVRGLILNPVCSTNPELFLRWEVENRSPFDVQFVWEIEGTDISGTVNATPGISEFFTEATGGDQYVKITWYDEEGNPRRQKKLSIDNACRVRGLILNPVCSTNPEVERRWELVNRNAFSVEVKMEDLSLKTTTFITALPGNSYFTTPYSEGELDVKITWIDEEGNPRRQQKTASAEECYNEFAGGQNTDTQDDDEQDVVVDVLNETVRTYPNPFSDRINLTMNVEPDAEGMFSILIYNVLGNMVYQGEVETSFGAIKTHINTADFSKGTYLMTIVSENNQFRETRILIKGQ